MLFCNHQEKCKHKRFHAKAPSRQEMSAKNSFAALRLCVRCVHTTIDPYIFYAFLCVLGVLSGEIAFLFRLFKNPDRDYVGA